MPAPAPYRIPRGARAVVRSDAQLQADAQARAQALVAAQTAPLSGLRRRTNTEASRGLLSNRGLTTAAQRESERIAAAQAAQMHGGQAALAGGANAAEASGAVAAAGAGGGLIPRGLLSRGQRTRTMDAYTSDALGANRGIHDFSQIMGLSGLQRSNRIEQDLSDALRSISDKQAEIEAQRGALTFDALDKLQSRNDAFAAQNRQLELETERANTERALQNHDWTRDRRAGRVDKLWELRQQQKAAERPSAAELRLKGAILVKDPKKAPAGYTLPVQATDGRYYATRAEDSPQTTRDNEISAQLAGSTAQGLAGKSGSELDNAQSLAIRSAISQGMSPGAALDLVSLNSPDSIRVEAALGALLGAGLSSAKAKAVLRARGINYDQMLTDQAEERAKKKHSTSLTAFYGGGVPSQTWLRLTQRS